jgi:NADPH:quinone reductase-like Zn-dependent oxidoreductase
MRAIVWTNYGPPEVLRMGELDLPDPRPKEVRVKVRATTVNIGDCHIRGLNLPFSFVLPLRLFMGPLRPKRIRVLGQELAGEVDGLGEGATRFRVGDPVFGPTLFYMGTYAEYARVPEKYLVPKPDGLTYEEAATIPTGGTHGLHLLNLAQVQRGEKVLINGAGGSIGTYAVQIAKVFGAEVTAVDSAVKLDMLRSIGADHVIDYAREDFTKRGERYDVIIDVVGKSPFSRSLGSLNPNGRYVLGNPGTAGRIRARRARPEAGKRVILELAAYRAEDYAILLDLVAKGKVKPVIDRSFTLEQTAEAHRYVEGGHKKGNVVITVSHSGGDL